MKNGGTGGGGWWEREFQEEAGEELVKVGWTRGRNGRGTVEEEIVYGRSRGKEEKSATEIGGLCEEKVCGIGKGMEVFRIIN